MYSPTGADKTIHLYFYNSGNPADTNVTEWASSRAGHFELMLPPPNGWSFDSGLTPRRGSGNRKRGAKASPNKSPLKPALQKDGPGSGDGPSSVERQRASRNKKRAEVSFGILQ